MSELASLTNEQVEHVSLCDSLIMDELPVKPDSSHVNEQRMEELLIVGTEQVPVKDYLVWSWINFILSLIELIFILFFCMKN